MYHFHKIRIERTTGECAQYLPTGQSYAGVYQISTRIFSLRYHPAKCWLVEEVNSGVERF